MSAQGKIASAERIHLVLGDQLHPRWLTESGFATERDVVLMIEAREEALHVPSHVQRTVLFLSAMRNATLRLRDEGARVRYVTLDDPENSGTLGGELRRAIDELGAGHVVVARPGEHRVEASLRRVCRESGTALDVRPDPSFTCSLDEFEAWADGRKHLVMEYFYRQRRRALDILLEDGAPTGGRWNLDAENRKTFREPPDVPSRYRPREDEITREVKRLVVASFPDAPGRMDSFAWPVTPDQARRSLADFVKHRLPYFGTYEDAMWQGEPVLYHSALSSSLNLKLVDPRDCVDAAVRAYENGDAALNNVEGFVRQVIGWREFIRGVYYREGPGYAGRNELGHQGNLPDLFWTGETELRCLRECVGEVLDHAYGHHIQRLMVIGNFALIARVRARAVHEWFLAMYADGVEWATAPNVVGMSQHADGGMVGTKPYAASGKYIQRMSNYCAGCRFDPKKRTGEDACPFNTLYWDFLMHHEARFRKNQRMGMSLRNVDRIDRGEKRELRRRAATLRRELGVE